jgi:tRNA pseudouridine55 synthase
VNPAGAAPRPARRPAPGPTLESSGLLLVDKPEGPTSHDLVMIARRALDAPGAGHLGTLDPGASGLLVVATGAATRCVPLLQSGDKTYEVAIRLGIETDTEDLSGRVVREAEVRVSEAQLREASARLTGELQQVPPMVSAIRMGGRRLHRLARAGVTVERSPRPVRVDEWTWLDLRLPEARARIVCSPGTYVRSLARDLGRALGCGAAVASLRRLRSEPWGLERAVTLEELRELPAAELRARAGVTLGEALARFPEVTVDPNERAALGNGRALRRAAHELAPAAGPVVLRDPAGVPLAIATPAGDADDPGVCVLQPGIVFPWAVRQVPA